MIKRVDGSTRRRCIMQVMNLLSRCRSVMEKKKKTTATDSTTNDACRSFQNQIKDEA